MSGFDWQNAIALAIVAGACGYLARLAWRTMARRSSTGCGGCSSCGADKPAQGDGGSKPLVTVESLVGSAPPK